MALHLIKSHATLSVDDLVQNYFANCPAEQLILLDSLQHSDL